MKKLFRYALLHVTPVTKDTPSETTLISIGDYFLAKDEASANKIAIRNIPEEYVEKLDEVVVVISPF